MRNLPTLLLLGAFSFLNSCNNSDRHQADDLPDVDDDDDSRLEVGLYLRTEATPCSEDRPIALPEVTRCGPNDDCRRHEDCVANGQGRCIRKPLGGWCGCYYDDCMNDLDCPNSEVCACVDNMPFTGDVYFRDADLNTCLEAECRTGEDCLSGLCMGNRLECLGNYQIRQFFCATDQDGCRDDAICEAGEFCLYSKAERRWTCQERDYSDCD